MDTETVKEEIHQLINNIDDIEFLKAVQTIISSKIQSESEENFLTGEEIQILEERQADYLSGKSKTYTWEEVKSRLNPKPNV
ncbi:MAG: addiction module protein [Bacteroidota bacterium]|nr:addiction module protein [Bacteroidota bacterium]